MSADTVGQFLPMGPGGKSRYLVPCFIHERPTRLNLQVVILARYRYDPTESPTTTPRPRHGFAAVSRATRQLPSRGRVSRRCSKLARRGSGMARQVPGFRMSPNNFSPLYAQHRGRSSSIFWILQISHSKKRCTNSRRYAVLKGCYRNRVRFQQILF